jgi:NAD(P)-dependent dehydrogenase (short-subunit alcohol dehydrogenase family)
MTGPVEPRALVTGAASGIGRAAARALRRRGVHVTGLDRRVPAAGTDGFAAADAWIAHDLEDLAVPLSALPATLDILVNAAGLPPRAGAEAQVLRVNFLALRRVTLAILPRLAPGGAIVNVASKAGARWRENADQVRRLMACDDADALDGFVASEAIDPVRAYDLSKEAVIAWTKAVTGPLIDRDLRMNCVSPAAVETPILSDFIAAFGERAMRGIERTRRAGRPEEVAEVVAFLADPASAWVRGTNVETDGGLAAQLDCAAAGLDAESLPPAMIAKGRRSAP